jgi:hypothetical protein
MFNWIRRLTAASAALSLGALTFFSGCNNDCDDCSRGEVTYPAPAPRYTSYDEGIEQATPTSYESERAMNREFAAPAPGFDRDMDRYQHPNEDVRQNINVNAPDYGPNYAPNRVDTGRPYPAPAPDLNAPSSRVPNATFNRPNANAPSARFQAPADRTAPAAPGANISTRNDVNVNTAPQSGPRSDLNNAPSAPNSDFNRATPDMNNNTAPSMRQDTQFQSSDVRSSTTTTTTSGPESSTSGTSSAAPSSSSTESMKSDDAANSGMRNDAANKGSADLPSTSNNPGAETSTTGTPRASQSPSSNTSGSSINTSTPASDRLDRSDRSSEQPVKSSSDTSEYGNVSGMPGNSADQSKPDNSDKTDTSSKPAHTESPAAPGGQ